MSATLAAALELVGLLTGGGVVGSVVTKLLGRRRDEAEAAAAITAAAVSLVAPLERRVLALELANERTNNTLRVTGSRLQLALDHIRALYTWISSHSFEPTPPQPPEELGL